MADFCCPGLRFSSEGQLHIEGKLLSTAKLPFWGSVVVTKDPKSIKSLKLLVAAGYGFRWYLVPSDVHLCPAWAAHIAASDVSDVTFQITSAVVDIVVPESLMALTSKTGNKPSAKVINISKWFLNPIEGKIGTDNPIVCRQIADADRGLAFTKANKVVDEMRLKIKKGLQALKQIPHEELEEVVTQVTTNDSARDPALKHLFR